jgi:hypothetical protein
VQETARSRHLHPPLSAAPLALGRRRSRTSRCSALGCAGLALALAVLAAACEHVPRISPITRELAIQLDAGGCPVSVVPNNSACPERPGKACVSKRNDRLRWTARKPFEIHFDPLRGRTIQSDACGNSLCKTAWVTIDRDAPPRETDDVTEVEYKYTVVVAGCAKPLDPGIFIQR